jgi:hypothetical protein
MYITLEDYREHPRILELKFSLFFANLRREYNYNDTIHIFRGLALSFQCNWEIIKGLIDNIFEMRRLEKIDWLRFRQEVLFIGYLKGKTKYQMAKEIGVKPALFYSTKYPYDAEKFADKNWLKELDKNVTLAGIPQYKIELEKFITGMDVLKEAL